MSMYKCMCMCAYVRAFIEVYFHIGVHVSACIYACAHPGARAINQHSTHMRHGGVWWLALFQWAQAFQRNRAEMRVCNSLLFGFTGASLVPRRLRGAKAQRAYVQMKSAMLARLSTYR